jgi:hypothetical protein
MVFSSGPGNIKQLSYFEFFKKTSFSHSLGMAVNVSRYVHKIKRVWTLCLSLKCGDKKSV